MLIRFSGLDGKVDTVGFVTHPFLVGPGTKTFYEPTVMVRTFYMPIGVSSKSRETYFTSRTEKRSEYTYPNSYASFLNNLQIDFMAKDDSHSVLNLVQPEELDEKRRQGLCCFYWDDSWY